MATSFETSPSSCTSDRDALHDSNDSSPEGGLNGFDFTSYIDCEVTKKVVIALPTANTATSPRLGYHLRTAPLLPPQVQQPHPATLPRKHATAAPLTTRMTTMRR